MDYFREARFLGPIAAIIPKPRSMSALACWRQPRITPGKGRRILADLRVAILYQ